MKIELMTADDVKAVADIEKEVFSMPWSEESVRDAVTNSNARYLVMKSGDNLAGYVGMWYGGDEAEITNVAVSEGYRRQGIAYELMKQAKEMAITDGMAKMFLEVRVSNESAIRLYEKMGFKSLGVRKNFYEKPVEDAKVMVLKLDGGEGA